MCPFFSVFFFEARVAKGFVPIVRFSFLCQQRTEHSRAPERACSPRRATQELWQSGSPARATFAQIGLPLVRECWWVYGALVWVFRATYNAAGLFFFLLLSQQDATKLSLGRR